MALRRALPFLLMPFVVVLMLTASSNVFGADTQPWTLAAGSVLVVIGILAIDLSVEARTGRKLLVAELRAHPNLMRAALLAATAATTLALALAEVHRQPLSGSWASLTLGLSLGCYALALVLFEVAVYEHALGWPIAVVIGFVTLVWPVAVIVLLPHFANHVSVVWVLALALVPAPAIWLATRRGTSPRASAGSSAADWACRCRFVQTSLLVASSMLLLVAALRVPIERKFTQTTDSGAAPIHGSPHPRTWPPRSRRTLPCCVSTPARSGPSARLPTSPIRRLTEPRSAHHGAAPAAERNPRFPGPC